MLIATLGEYVLSAVLGLYRYRLGNLPAFVPPGHGLVYLAALSLARAPRFVRHGALMRGLALALGGSWALWGVTVAARPDALGLVLYVLFAAFTLAGRAPLVYAAAFLLTTYLELVGTVLGNWTWAEHAAGGLLTMGNPPSGVPGVYCLLDALAIASGSAVARARGCAAERAGERAAVVEPARALRAAGRG